jgi:hypothetical protein
VHTLHFFCLVLTYSIFEPRTVLTQIGHVACVTAALSEGEEENCEDNYDDDDDPNRADCEYYDDGDEPQDNGG